jgi:2'-5' RNA ligase
MRLFTGISVAPAVLSKIEEVLQRLRPLAKVRWSPAANVHITTKFIGEWPEDRLRELQHALTAVKSAGNIHIQIHGFGFLPEARYPKVFFAGVDGGAQLPELARQTEKALEPLGCAPETRPYRPHLTLAKIKNESVSALREFVDANPAIDFGSFDATSFHLYLSKPNAGGTVYTELATWGLS